MPGGKTLLLSEVIGWENSCKHSNYIVYVLRFMSLTRLVFVVSTHRMLEVLGKRSIIIMQTQNFGLLL